MTEASIPNRLRGEFVAAETILEARNQCEAGPTSQAELRSMENAGITRQVSREDFLADLVKAYAGQIRLLGEAGCTNQPIDDTMFVDAVRPNLPQRDPHHVRRFQSAAPHVHRLVNEAVAKHPRP